MVSAVYVIIVRVTPENSNNIAIKCFLVTGLTVTPNIIQKTILSLKKKKKPKKKKKKGNIL